MGLTNEELSQLRALKRNAEDDNIRYKQIIKEKILDNKKIIHVLDNKSLDEDTPDEYYGVNIFPCYCVPEVASKVDNYICFETGFDTLSTENELIKYFRIYFYVLCNTKNITDKDTGIPKHDLLGDLIIEQFNYNVFIQGQVKLVSDMPISLDDNYCCRVLTFETQTTNSIARDNVRRSNYDWIDGK